MPNVAQPTMLQTEDYAAPVSYAQPIDPWQQYAAAYGLGAPPAEGLPATLPGVTIGAPPQMQFDQQAFQDYMNQINGQIGGAYNYATPQMNASLIDRSQVPNPTAQQFGESPQLQQLLSGQGYSPETLAMMRATATEGPAQAGLQQMSQMKRYLGDAGVQGGAAAAVQGDIARQTGQAQSAGLRDVATHNADVANQNLQFGVGQQSQIGLSNMQAANQMAIQNANMMFSALQSNQNAQNSANQVNTQNQAQQKLTGANAQASFLGQQGAQGQQQRQDTSMQNNQNAWQGQQMQTNLDWQKQTKQWDELNNRFGQAQNILGQWGNA